MGGRKGRRKRAFDALPGKVLRSEAAYGSCGFFLWLVGFGTAVNEQEDAASSSAQESTLEYLVSLGKRF